jgi:hypothetical protein
MANTAEAVEATHETSEAAASSVSIDFRRVSLVTAPGSCQ